MNWKEFVDFTKRVDEIYHDKGMDDGEKHREVACRAAQFGEGMENRMRALGNIKEVYDITRKNITNERKEKWGGTKAIAEDSKKDLRNNEIGFRLGRENPKGDCREMTKSKKK